MNFLDTLSASLFGGAPSPMSQPQTLFPNSGAPVQPSLGMGGLSAQPQGLDVASVLKSVLANPGGRSAAPPPPQMAGNGLADALGSILKNSGAVQKPQPAIPAGPAPETLPWQRSATPAAAPDAVPASGITGQDVASFLRSVMTGAAGVDPSRPGIGAFAQGASGAMAARDALSEREKATKLAEEDRSMKLDDRAFDRAKDIRGESRADAREKREGRLNEIKMLEATAKVMRDVDPSLDIKDRIAVERLVRDEGKRLMDAEALSGEELQTAMETYRKDIEGRLTANKPRITGAQPAPAAKSGTGATSKAPTGSGDGKSQSSPAAPVDKSAFDALPSGAWFVNPADGRVLQKK